MEIPVTTKDYFIDIDRRDIEYSEQPVLFKMCDISQVNISLSAMNCIIIKSSARVRTKLQGKLLWKKHEQIVIVIITYPM